MENLSEGCCHCHCHCDGGKTKSTPSLALGLGWSLTKKKKLTYENNGHLSFPVTRFRNQRSFKNSSSIWYY